MKKNMTANVNGVGLGIGLIQSSQSPRNQPAFQRPKFSNEASSYRATSFQQVPVGEDGGTHEVKKGPHTRRPA